MTDETLPAVPWADSESPSRATGVGSVAAAAHAMASIRTAMEAAAFSPRSEKDCYARIVQACDRPGLAAEAQYMFPRGGTPVKGASVVLAREAARMWRNLRWGMDILQVTTEDHPNPRLRRQQRVHVRGWCWDVETNTYTHADDSFWLLHQRRAEDGATDWVVPDERDARELVNRRGAICERNAILRIIPRDVIEDARKRANATLHDNAETVFKDGRETATKRLVVSFADYSVTSDDIETYLGHDLDSMTPEEYADLQTIWRSIRDDPAVRDQTFGKRKRSKKAKKATKPKKDDAKEAERKDPPVPDGAPENPGLGEKHTDPEGKMWAFTDVGWIQTRDGAVAADDPDEDPPASMEEWVERQGGEDH